MKKTSKILSGIIIVSPGKCAGSSIAISRSDITYTHGPFFRGFTKTGQKIKSHSRRLKTFIFDLVLFFKIVFAKRLLVIMRDERSWNEAMFWQDFPKIYLDALNANEIGNKQDDGLLQDLFRYWIALSVWQDWNKYFTTLFFWYSLKQEDFSNLPEQRWMMKRNLVLIDYNYCFSKAGKHFILQELGIDLNAVKRINDGSKKWYAELRQKFKSEVDGF